MSEPTDAGEVTRLLVRIQAGDKEAESDLFAALESDLRRLASGQLERRGSGETLEPTALVHEVWIRLSSSVDGLAGRQHLLAVAAKAMRSILVDHARARLAAKRGGDHRRVALDEVLEAYEDRGGDLLALHEALERLAVERPRQARIVELRFFGGLTVEQIAEVLGVARATVTRDWHLARIQLRDRLG